MVGGQGARDLILYEDVQLRIKRHAASGRVALSGQIDAWNADRVAATLAAAAPPAGDLELDLSLLLFWDVRGMRALVASAGSLREGGRLVLHGVDPRLERVLEIVGWKQAPGLVLVQAAVTP